MDEAGEVVAVALNRLEVVNDQLIRCLTLARVLVIERHGEDLEPDALEVGPDDVLPGDDRSGGVTTLDEGQRPPLEACPREVLGPPESVSADPRLHIVLER